MRNIAIAIGINKYRNLQDLKYAKNDAQYFCDFLRQEAGFEKIWYFSDDSPTIAGNSTEPIRSNLLTVLDDLSVNSPLEGIDNLWFFFAGHGSIHQNDGNDYLLMADSNQNLLEDTAISTQRILQKLRLSGAENIIVFLDACRSLGKRDGRGIGDRTTAEVKKIANTVCFFSCSPKEFSWELDEYEHGVFTYALVEGLGVQRKKATIEKLGSFLELRVPELAKAEAKEVQNPIVVYDSKLKHAILMPRYADKSDLLPLKNAAIKAHRNKNLDLARRLWMQILAVDGTDYDAITEIEGLAVERYLSGLSQVMPNPAPANEKRTVRKVPDTDSLTIDLGNGVTLELVKVPLGKFMMGSPDGELSSDSPISDNWNPNEHQTTVVENFDDFDDMESILDENFDLPAFDDDMESILDENFDLSAFDDDIPLTEGYASGCPQHQVILQEFLIGKYAVTNAQWQAVTKTQGSANYDKKFQGDLQPVVGVSWHEAREFCNKLQELTGRTARLPTEAEWEYACRAGTTTPFAFGETVTSEEVNYNGNYPYGDAPKGKYREVTVNVNSFQPNAWGIYQMHGNVWEWCLDEWHDSYADKPENLKKQGNQAWGDLNVDKNDNRYRLLRGGSWNFNARYCRAAFRNWYDARDQNDSIGFRVLLIFSY